MWASIPRRLQEEWQVFYELEPDELERLDWNIAHLAQLLAQNGKPLREFVLPFGDRPSAKAVQSLAFQEMLIDGWVLGSNALLKKKGSTRA